MIKILTIDGGGIRGILPGELLHKLERIIQKKTNNDNAKIGDYFDMIAGTSTGGILTTFLLCPGDDGKAKYHAKDAVELYIKNGDQIFHKSLMHSITSLGGIIEEKYPAVNLENILKENLGEDLWLSDLIKPCLLPSYDIQNRRTMFFNQFDAVRNEHYDFKVWEIARATSAAPTYFETAKISSKTGNEYALVDGGVFANNSSICAYVEAREHFKNENGRGVSAKDIFMVSLGTGSAEKPYMYNKAKGWGAAEWLKPIIDIMMSGSAETVDYQLKHVFDSEDVPHQYFRIEPTLGAADVDMDNVKEQNLQALKLAGEKSALAFEDKLNTIADVLIQEHHQIA